MDDLSGQPLRPHSVAEATDRFDLACELVDSGLSIFPIRTDGTKAPAIPAWKHLQERIPTCQELFKWFHNRELGFGIVCGIVSGGLEVLDFDEASLFKPWFESLTTDLASKLTIVRTPKGWHCYFRCDEIGNNSKIAVTSDGKRARIETRAEGGYVVGPGSPAACHPTGRLYERVAGPSMLDIQRITPEERRQLWAAARVFDQRPAKEIAKLRAKVNGWDSRRSNPDSDTPEFIRKFNAMHTWADILIPHGWTTCDGIHWTRPGKRFGVSAKVATASDGEELLVVFSSNAGPLAADGEPKKFNKFYAWMHLRHAGSYRAAATEAEEATR